MATLLFKLHNVPEDEAGEVRELFREHQLDTYETSAGRWGSGVAAIWLADDSQRERAQALLEGYQRQRAYEAQERYRVAQPRPLIQTLTEQPLRLAGAVLATLVILGLMTVPLLDLFKG